MLLSSIKNFFSRLAPQPAFIAAIFLLVGLFFGWELKTHMQTASLAQSVTRIGIQNNPYKFVNPLLAVDVKTDSDKDLEGKLQYLINNYIMEGKLTEAGIYFRNLGSGEDAGINADAPFYPASLLKVPLMITYLKLAQYDPALLGRKLVYNGNSDANQLEYFKPQKAIEKGKSYSIDELITYMIAYSDNNAANLLVENLDDPSFKAIYKDLGIQLPQDGADKDFLSPKQYALFFRILRNGTYLDWDFSEKALELLTYADFPDGILGGVPVGTLVANKFGEHLELDNGKKINELHDCGIVYYPKDDYLLCVMTKGTDYEQLKEVIKQISKLTFDHVSAKNK